MTEKTSAIAFQSPGRFAIDNPSTDAAASPPVEAAAFHLGQPAPLQRFHTPAQALPHALALLQQARRTLCLFTPDLEPLVYGQSAVEDACRRLLIGHPRNQLRILVQEPSHAIRNGHRLIGLSRRLTSNLHIRRAHPDYPVEAASCLLVDDAGLLVRPRSSSADGYAQYHDPGRVRALRRQFDRAWDHGILDPDLRSFLL